MEPPTSASLPEQWPAQIRHAPRVSLSAGEIALLSRAFVSSQEIFVEREFRSGYSGAVVLLVSPGPGHAPVVVKLGTPADLQREYAAYVQFVEQSSPQNTARLQGEPLLAEDGQLALLIYTFAGGDPRLPTRSLQAYYESQGGQATAAVLNRVFRIYGRQWWTNNHLRKFTWGEQYDRLLPVHLKFRPIPCNTEQGPRASENSEPGLTLSAGQVNVMFLRTLQPGQSIRLQGFRVSEVREDRGEVTFIASPPQLEASPSLRLRLETDDTSAYQLGDLLEKLDVTVTATRQTLLAENARSIFSPLNPNDSHLTLNGLTFPNPLLELSRLLDSVTEMRASTIHGDLNLQNILVDEVTGFAWLIDFAETRLGPTLFDLQRLESQVITKLLPPIVIQAGLRPTVVADLLEALHTDPPSPLALYPALQEPYHVLVALRMLARQYLIDDRDWDEYYLGLKIVLLGTLKFKDLELLAQRLAFLGAATVQGLIGKPVTRGGSHPYLTQYRGETILDASAPSKTIQSTSTSSRWPRWLAFLGIGWLKPRPEPEPPLALVINVQGWVEVRRKTSTRIIPAAFGMPLFFGDAIITYEASTTDVVCNNGFLFHLDKQSTLVVRCGGTDEPLPQGRLPGDLAQQLIQPGAVLSAIAQTNLNLVKQAVDHLGLDRRAQNFLWARLYQRMELPRKAIVELVGLSSRGETPGIAQTLGEAYFQAGLWEQAATNYTMALKEAGQRGDLIGRAEAHLGLGHLANANGEVEAVKTHWQIAASFYRQEGYLTRADEVTALLSRVTAQPFSRFWLLDFVRQLGGRISKVWRRTVNYKGQGNPATFGPWVMRWGTVAAFLLLGLFLIRGASSWIELSPPTATPIAIVDIPTSTATRTSTPMSTNTPRPTDTSTATSTSIPSDTPTSVIPTGTTSLDQTPTVASPIPTFTLTPMPTVPSVTSPPMLLDPQPNASQYRNRLELLWDWPGTLGPDDYFQVEIRNRYNTFSPVIDESVEPIDVSWVKVKYYSYDYVEEAYDREYTWRVIVVQGIPQKEKQWSIPEYRVWEPGPSEPISQPSEMRTVFVEPGTEPPPDGSSSGAAGPNHDDRDNRR